MWTIHCLCVGSGEGGEGQVEKCKIQYSDELPEGYFSLESTTTEKQFMHNLKCTCRAGLYVMYACMYVAYVVPCMYTIYNNSMHFLSVFLCPMYGDLLVMSVYLDVINLPS